MHLRRRCFLCCVSFLISSVHGQTRNDLTSSRLYGITVAQFAFYLWHYPEDDFVLKGFVRWSPTCLIPDFTHSVLFHR